MWIAVDFDGTVVTHEYPIVGRDIGAVPVLRKLINNKHKLLLNTMRSGQSLDSAIDWFNVRNIFLHGINTNPSQKEWTISPKCYAELYIDDAALGVPLVYPDDGQTRPYVDWKSVELILCNKGIIV